MKTPEQAIEQAEASPLFDDWGPAAAPPPVTGPGIELRDHDGNVLIAWMRGSRVDHFTQVNMHPHPTTYRLVLVDKPELPLMQFTLAPMDGWHWVAPFDEFFQA